MTSEERAMQNLRDNIALRLVGIQEFCEMAGVKLDGITFIGRDTTNDNMVIVLTSEPGRTAMAALDVAGRYLAGAPTDQAIVTHNLEAAQ
jgi:hypothetical protein